MRFVYFYPSAGNVRGVVDVRVSGGEFFPEIRKKTIIRTMAGHSRNAHNS